jgi:hypothetical protein
LAFSISDLEMSFKQIHYLPKLAAKKEIIAFSIGEF